MYLVAGVLVLGVMIYGYGIQTWHAVYGWCTDSIYTLGANSELCCRISGGKIRDIELRVSAQNI
jgi:hypothetical protein